MNEVLEPAFKPTVLVVDDTPDYLTQISALLKDHYRVQVANHGEKCIRIATAETGPDLILLDIMMPDLDGYEVLRRLKGYPATRDIPVIFLTARNQEEDERIGLELGAVDYITKPISPSILLARVANHLQLRAAREMLKERSTSLEIEVFKRTRELALVRDVTIAAMATMAEIREGAVGRHLRRIQHYTHALAQQLRHHPRFAAALTATTIEQLFRAAPLHDLGRVGLPDRLLYKRGAYTPDEFEIVKRHPQLGREILEAAEGQVGGAGQFLALAKEIAYCHQERWDGSGYPQGLRGEAIPLSARLVAVADAYDTLTCRKLQEAAISHAAALESLKEGRGTRFDPDILDGLFQVEAEFHDIALKFQDSDEDLAQKYRYMQESAPGPRAL